MDTNRFLLHSPGCLVSPGHVAVLDEGEGIAVDLLGVVAGDGAEAGQPGVSLHADDHHELLGHSVVLGREGTAELQATSTGKSRNGSRDGLAARSPLSVISDAG